MKKESAFDNLDITDEERAVFELIARQASTADEICSMLNIDFSELTVLLMNLELNGYIRQIDGGKYISEIS